MEAPMSNVQEAIEAAAGRFASEVVSLLRNATLQDILSLTGKTMGGPLADGVRRQRAATAVDRSKRRTRPTGRKRSREEVARLAERILQFLGTQKEEIGVSGIGEALKVPTADLGLPLQKLRAENKVKTRGQKRSTVYRIA
jgi:hypothetical protein